MADVNKTIADAFDVLAGERTLGPDGKLEVTGEMIAYRGLFLIDKEGIVRHALVNDMPLGRSVDAVWDEATGTFGSVDEAIRIVDALQHVEKYGEVCPLGWHKGEAAMTPSHEGVADYLSH